MSESGLQPRDGRTPRCHACGFDLTGLPAAAGASLICPECGAQVRLELAYSTPRERATEWLQKPAEPTPARMALTTAIMLAAASISLLGLLVVLYIVWLFLSLWATGP